MSWISRWWSSVNTKILMDAIKKVFVAFCGKVGADLRDAAIQAVKEAELTGLSGVDKYKLAFNNLRMRYKSADITDRLIKAAIELAVEYIDPKVVA